MLNIAICDDNLTYLNATMMIVNNYFKNKNIEFQLFPFSESSELKKWIKDFGDTLHIVILDISLDSHKSGIKMAKNISAIHKSVQIVFMTAYIENAADICEAEFTYFVYKKKDWIAKLQKAMDKALKNIEQSKTHQVLVNDYLIDTNNISFIESNKKYCTVNFDNDEPCSIKDGIMSFLEKLPSNFYQIHRCTIINMDFVDKIDKADKKAILKSGKSLGISRSRFKDFTETYYNYLSRKLSENK